MRAARIAWSVVGAALAAAVVVALGVSTPSSKERLREFFELDDVGSVDALQRGVDARFPAGTTEAAIRAWLDEHGVGADEYSSYEVDRRADVIRCRVERRPLFDGCDYVVWFQLDADLKLTSVRVGRRFMRF
jgi:hypothetical protein